MTVMAMESRTPASDEAADGGAARTERSLRLPKGRPFTVGDLEAMPNDGNRYELIDGMLLVSPAPSWRHQVVQLELGSRLRAACPAEFEAVGAPFDVISGDQTDVQPDVVVGRFGDFTSRGLPASPVLVVEILSPSTARVDLTVKKSAYATMGVPTYWIFDPVAVTLTVLELDTEGEYQQTAEVKETDAFDAKVPFEVRIIPSELIGRSH